MIELRDDREAALDAAYLALRDRVGVSRNDFAKAFDGFDVKVGVCGGEAIGAVFTKGPEIHVAVVPRYQKQWASRRLIWECLGGIVKRFGYATTRVMNDNPKGMEFVKRLGFVPTDRDEVMTLFEVTA